MPTKRRFVRLGGRGPNTQAKQLMKQGDSGYMAIFQVEDQEGVSNRLLGQGVRAVGTPTMMFNEPLGNGGGSHLTPDSAVSKGYTAGDAVSKNDEFCIKNDEFCTKNENLCIKNDELCRLAGRNARRGAEGHPCCGGILAAQL